MILVGNKIDLPNRVISNEEATNLARQYNCSFLEVSAFTGSNVEQIFISLSISIFKSKQKNQAEKMDYFEENNNSHHGNSRGKKLKIGAAPQNIGVSASRKGSCC